MKVENCTYNWLLYVVSSWSYGAGIHIHELGDSIYNLDGEFYAWLIVINDWLAGENLWVICMFSKEREESHELIDEKLQISANLCQNQRKIAEKQPLIQWHIIWSYF